MIKLLKKYKLLIIILLLTVLILLSLGYIFAQQQSEPTFATKIDRIMFERKNRSPKFIITLPDEQQKKLLKDREEANISAQKIEIAENKDKSFSAIELVNTIPLMSKLKAVSNPQALLPTDAIPELVENKDNMILPKMADDGRKPWIEYSKKENNNDYQN